MLENKYANPYNDLLQNNRCVYLFGQINNESSFKCITELMYLDTQGEDDILLIHDAVRPLVSQEILSDCIVKCRKYGSAVVTVPCNTVILKKKDELSSEEVVDRQELAVTQTPQAFPLHKLVWAHKEALKRGITNSVASCTLMTELGESVYFSVGAETNIKLTTQDDLMIFKALLAIQEQKGKY